MAAKTDIETLKEQNKENEKAELKEETYQMLEESMAAGDLKKEDKTKTWNFTTYSTKTKINRNKRNTRFQRTYRKSRIWIF